jgi:hypothetical protein
MEVISVKLSLFCPMDRILSHRPECLSCNTKYILTQRERKCISRTHSCEAHGDSFAAP